MIVTCPKCSARLQPAGNKPLVHPFAVRCPKCNTTVNSEAPNPASVQSALAVGNSPSTSHRSPSENEPAPLFEVKGADQPANSSSVEELIRMMANVFGQTAGNPNVANGARPSWNPRKILICTTEQHRQSLALQLSLSGYQVFVAEDTRQAVERMRENRLDVVLLDQEFDSEEQGSAFVTREVTVLRPAQRRRLFFVLLSPVLRTMESHAAFLNNVNAIVNIKEIDNVPKVLEHALREYNELYKEFNVALNAPPL